MKISFRTGMKGRGLYMVDGRFSHPMVAVENIPLIHISIPVIFRFWSLTAEQSSAGSEQQLMSANCQKMGDDIHMATHVFNSIVITS